MRRHLLAVLAAAALAAAFVAPASAATGVMLSGIPLVGPNAIVRCDTGAPYFPGLADMARSPGPGMVGYIASDTMVGGTATLKGAAPYTRYVVRFIQATPDSAYWPSQCHGVDGYIWTDAVGNGSLYVREWRIPSAVALTFIIDTGSEYVAPTYRPTMEFALTPLVPYVPPTVVGPARTGSPISSHR
jgi:hypothetical protein